MDEQIALLYEKDANKAYQAMLILKKYSQDTDILYPYMDQFISMLQSKHSYVRTRGLVLVAANTKWDTKHKVEAIIDDYKKYIVDNKPITARKCIQTLPIIVKAKPKLKQKVLHMLQTADMTKYANTMQPLLKKDIYKAVQDIEKM